MGTGDITLYSQWISNPPSILADNFEDGSLGGIPEWIDGGSDSTLISIYDNAGDWVLKVPRGSDYGTAVTDISFFSDYQNFDLSFDTQYFGDSLGRPMVKMYDDSGQLMLYWYANTWQDEYH